MRISNEYSRSPGTDVKNIDTQDTNQGMLTIQFLRSVQCTLNV